MTNGNLIGAAVLGAMVVIGGAACAQEWHCFMNGKSVACPTQQQAWPVEKSVAPTQPPDCDMAGNCLTPMCYTGNATGNIVMVPCRENATLAAQLRAKAKALNDAADVLEGK